MPPLKTTVPKTTTQAAVTARVQSDESLLAYLPLVKSVARRVFQFLPPTSLVEFPDLVQAGLMGLVLAARSYDPTIRCSFPTYALYRIRGEMLDALRRAAEVSRSVRRWERQCASAHHHLAGTLRRRPTSDELCRHLQLSMTQWEHRRLSLARIPHTLPPAGQENHAPPPEEATPAEEQPDALAARQQLVAIVHDALRRLPERTRIILQLYYRDELSMKQIGKIFRINESRISQIHKQALKSVERTLRARGIASAQGW